MKNKKILIIKFIFFFLIFSKSVYGNECNNKNDLKVGLLKDNFINYEPFLYYSLGNYSLINSLEFEINYVENNPEEFDIIFGEYYNLEKYSKFNLNYPQKINKFYKNNEITISGNILPLDLDTFILLSHQNISQLNLQELSNYYDSTKYTLGLNFINKKNLIDLFHYNLGNLKVDINNISVESNLNLYNKIYANLNKNIIYSNHNEIFESYQNKENVFTLFSDGILLYKNLKFNSFQLFPKNRYKWVDKDGLFIESEIIEPVSSFGFSAYVESSDYLGFICYLLEEDIRIKTFRNFNIQISPFSINEVKLIQNILPEDYLKVLEKKNKFIINNNSIIKKANTELLIDSITNDIDPTKFISSIEYLNQL